MTADPRDHEPTGVGPTAVEPAGVRPTGIEPSGAGPAGGQSARGPVLAPTLREVLGRAERPPVGLWNASGSPVAAEILAAAGTDLLLVDGEHGPIDLREILAILQAAAPYPGTTPLVRVPWNDEVHIKQVLDLGAQNLLVPMVSSAAEAQAAVAAVRYPGADGERPGRRGIGSALARSSRWGLVPEYVRQADEHVSLTVQIETAGALAAAEAIARTDGVDAVFIGPADLAGQLGHPGNPSCPEVVAAVDRTVQIVRDAGVPVGVNAFATADADRVLAAGADFVVVGADVSLIAQGARATLDRARTGHPSPLSEFPHVICNQARVQDYFAEVARTSPARITPDYGWTLRDLTVEQGAPYPVVAVLERSTETTTGAPERRVVRAKYAVGGDGARSTVRQAIGGTLRGDSRNHAWGVMDVLVDTDLPDARTKCVIQPADGGNILFIPREGNCLTRVYVDLGDIPADNHHRVRDTPIEQIIETAQRIFHPYRYDVKHVAWWSVYEVGQRLTGTFDDVTPAERGRRHPRVFIAGDACHTHSAKAGQGMNVSMQDTFNLGWKLGHVLNGRADDALLDTYSVERQVVGQKLIDFDREWSTIMAARTLDPERPELSGIDPAEVRRLYDASEVQASGFGVHYQPSLITGEAAHQHLATGFPISKRFWSAPVMRVCDATRQQLGHHMRADGRWRLYAFAGREPLGAGGAVESWAQWLATDPASPYVTTRAPGADAGALFDVKVIWQQGHDDVEHVQVPEVFRPRFGPFQVHDEELVYAADPRADIFDLRGIDRDRGCVVVVRPDMYVATVLPLDRPEELAAYFAPFLLPVDRPAAVC